MNRCRGIGNCGAGVGESWAGMAAPWVRARRYSAVVAGLFSRGGCCNSVKTEVSSRISLAREECDEAWEVAG